MWLTWILLSRRRVSGKQWIGKYRKKKKVTMHQRIRQKEHEEHLEKMTSLLSQPYLTMGEEACQVLAKYRRNLYKPKWIREREKKWFERDASISR